MDDHNARVDGVSDTIDFTREMLSKFDIGSSVAVLDTVASLDPETVLSTACVVLSAASNVAALKFPDMTMYKVLASLERIEGNLKKILETPLKKAINTFEFILKAVRSGNFKSAFDKLERLIDNAETAFLYADKDELSIKDYRECAKGIRLFMFGHLLKESYNEERRVFLSLEQLQPSKVTLIGETLEMIARRCIEQKKNVKTTSWGFESDTKKSEAQDVLDSILKFAYPYISRAKKLTDMNRNLMIQDSSCYPQFCLLADLLPMGYEDAAQLPLGNSFDSLGQKYVVKVAVWREKDSVRCEYEKFRNMTNIKPETQEVVMELPMLCPGPLHLNYTGLVWNRSHTRHKGDYFITDQKHNGRPVYKRIITGNEGYYLYSEDDGTWTVDGACVGCVTPEMKSTTAAPCPALCQEWLYTGNPEKGGPPWKKGDITVICMIHSQ